MAKKIKKLYKTRTITLGEEDVEIRAYRPGDGPLVREIMKTQVAMEKLAQSEEDTEEAEVPEEKRWKMFDLRGLQEEACVPLAQRGVKRALIPEARNMTPEELDELDDFELDPDDMVAIAWAMINMGLPNRTVPTAGADKGKKKTVKKSAQKSTGKTNS